MRLRIPLLTSLFTAGLFALPLVAHAGIPFFGPIIPRAFADCPAGWGMLITVINNIISFLITLSIVFVAPLMIAYSGFLFVVNPVASDGISKAKGILTHTVVGIVIALAGWMIVDALMAVLYDPAKVGTTWSQLITSGNLQACPRQAGAPSRPGVIAPTPTAVTVPTGTIPAKIAAATSAYTGTSTRAGPNGGRLACAWAVNNILTNAGIAKIDGDSVPAMETALISNRGARIYDQSAAVAGDLVIESGSGHVGVCLNSGCSQVMSNSSGRASFSWPSGPDFSPSYKNGTGRFYRVKN